MRESIKKGISRILELLRVPRVQKNGKGRPWLQDFILMKLMHMTNINGAMLKMRGYTARKNDYYWTE